MSTMTTLTGRVRFRFAFESFLFSSTPPSLALQVEEHTVGFVLDTPTGTVDVDRRAWRDATVEDLTEVNLTMEGEPHE